MKFYRLHENPNAILVTPQYNKHYGEKLKEEYPGYKIVESIEVPLGYSYLYNEEELDRQYQEKLSARED